MSAKQAGSPHGAYCWCGGALASGKASGDSANPPFYLRWDRILSITGWSSIQWSDVSAMTFTELRQWVQGTDCLDGAAFRQKAPWNRVRLSLGLGINDASFAMTAPAHPCAHGIPYFLYIISSGSNMKCMDVRMPSSAWMRENGHMCCAIPKAFTRFMGQAFTVGCL